MRHGIDIMHLGDAWIFRTKIVGVARRTLIDIHSRSMRQRQ